MAKSNKDGLDKKFIDAWHGEKKHATVLMHVFGTIYTLQTFPRALDRGQVNECI